MSGDRAGGNGRVLLVEGDTFLRRACEVSLRQRGLEVTSAVDGKEGLRLARAVPPPHAIVIDLLMPGLSGLALLRTLKSDATTAAIPVVILAASMRDEDRQQALELGAAAFYVTANLAIRDLATGIIDIINEQIGGHADR